MRHWDGLNLLEEGGPRIELENQHRSLIFNHKSKMIVCNCTILSLTSGINNDFLILFKNSCVDISF